MATSATLFSHTSLSSRCNCLREAFSPEPISERTKRLLPTTFCCCPGLQTLQLGVQVFRLAMPTDSPIQKKHTLTGFPYQSFDFRPGNARFVTHSARCHLA